MERAARIHDELRHRRELPAARPVVYRDRCTEARPREARHGVERARGGDRGAVGVAYHHAQLVGAGGHAEELLEHDALVAPLRFPHAAHAHRLVPRHGAVGSRCAVLAERDLHVVARDEVAPLRGEAERDGEDGEGRVGRGAGEKPQGPHEADARGVGEEAHGPVHHPGVRRNELLLRMRGQASGRAPRRRCGRAPRDQAYRDHQRSVSPHRRNSLLEERAEEV